MDYLFVTGLILLAVIFISLIISVYLENYNNKYKSVWAITSSRLFSSLAGCTTFTLIIGIILLYFPQYRRWGKLSNPPFLE